MAKRVNKSAPTRDASASTRTKDGYRNALAGLGYGANTLGNAGSYQTNYLSRNRNLTDQLYRSSWLVGKAVDAAAEDMVRKQIEIVAADINPDDIEELTVYWRDLRIWDRISDVIKWGRLYGGAIGIYLIDGQAPETPLRIETVRKGQFKGLLALDRWCVNPDLSRLVNDYGPDFGLPEFYDTVGGNNGIPPMRIHFSRVFRIVGQELPYFQRQAEQLWGQSVLERLYDRLLAFDSTTQGASQLAFRAHLRTIKINGLRDVIALGGPGLTAITKQVEFMRLTQSNEGITLLDAGDEFESHQYAFGGLDTLLLQFGQQLSGAMDIPLVRLFGQSPAGLNSTGESDLVTYYDGIHVKQEHDLRSPVGKLLSITYRSKYGSNPPKGMDFAFKPLWQMSDMDKSQITGTRTTAIVSAYTSGLIDQQTALKELRSLAPITGAYSSVTDELIDRAETEFQSGDVALAKTNAEMNPGDMEELEDESENEPGDLLEMRSGGRNKAA